MNRFKAGMLTTGIAAILLCSGAITETLRSERLSSSEDSSRWEDLPQELRGMLSQSWAQGMEVIRNNPDQNGYNVDITGWKLLHSLDDALNLLPPKTHSSLMDAYYSKERRAMLESGDIMPALLLHPDHTKAIQFWEKHDGTYAIIVMDTRFNENGSPEWVVSRSQEINKP